MSVIKRYTGSEWELIGGGGSSSLVAETVVSGSAVTSVTFSGLDANAAGGYVLEYTYANATTSGFDSYVYINNDTSSNNTDYRSVLIYYYYGQTVSGASQNNPLFISGGLPPSDGCSGSALIAKDPNGKVHMTSQYTKGVGATNQVVCIGSCTKNTAITNISSITITAAVTNAIAVGSTFRLYRRK